MVNQKILIRDKYRKHKKLFIVLFIFFLIIATISILLLIGYNLKKSRPQIVLENPIKGIIFANTNEAGEVNKSAVVEQAILEFNAEYINYLIIALGANHLHKSYVGYGNPIIELNIDDETWTSEISGSSLITEQTSGEKEDLRISLSRGEAVEAILSPNIQTFMKTSVTNGNTKIEQVAGKIELGSKGYLAMYKEITGEEIDLEE
jgi:hypothetical protein